MGLKEKKIITRLYRRRRHRFGQPGNGPTSAAPKRFNFLAVTPVASNCPPLPPPSSSDGCFRLCPLFFLPPCDYEPTWLFTLCHKTSWVLVRRLPNPPKSLTFGCHLPHNPSTTILYSPCPPRSRCLLILQLSRHDSYGQSVYGHLSMRVSAPDQKASCAQ